MEEELDHPKAPFGLASLEMIRLLKATDPAVVDLQEASWVLPNSDAVVLLSLVFQAL